MKKQFKTVISASRRTDIPAFYMEWFMRQIVKGTFEVVNPYNRHISRVKAAAADVDTIVFWSKNFGPFLKGRYGEKLIDLGYHLFFNFTINSEERLLEPDVPTLTERLDQIYTLCKRFGAERVQWRFDPVCFYIEKNGNEKNNMNDFDFIASKVSNSGINRCITSFVDLYPKVIKREKTISGFSFVDPPLDKKIKILLHMEKLLASKSIELYTCCEKELVEAIPPESSIKNSSCIPNRLLAELSAGRISLRKDSGQRLKEGCGCLVSTDIGSYNLHPCFHNCIFCYANPSEKKVS